MTLIIYKLKFFLQEAHGKCRHLVFSSKTAIMDCLDRSLNLKDYYITLK